VGWHGLPGGGVNIETILPHRINIELNRIAKEAAKGFQNAAFKILVILFVENFDEVVDAHCHADHLFSVAPEVRREAVVFRVI
jgi:hypothetical protein